MPFNDAYNPMDLNHDGHISNVELSAVMKEVNNAGGKKWSQKHPILAKILFVLAFLALCTVLVLIWRLLYNYKRYTEMIISMVIVAIPAIYAARILILHYIRKKRTDSDS